MHILKYIFKILPVVGESTLRACMNSFNSAFINNIEYEIAENKVCSDNKYDCLYTHSFELICGFTNTILS